MRKMILFLALIIGLQSSNICQAEDVWVCGDNQSATYVVTETCQNHGTQGEPYVFNVNAKVVRGKNVDVLEYYFYTWNSTAFHSRISDSKLRAKRCFALRPYTKSKAPAAPAACARQDFIVNTGITPPKT